MMSIVFLIAQMAFQVLERIEPSARVEYYRFAEPDEVFLLTEAALSHQTVIDTEVLAPKVRGLALAYLEGLQKFTESRRRMVERLKIR